jgi:hypothetical protein
MLAYLHGEALCIPYIILIPLAIPVAILLYKWLLPKDYDK